MKEKNLEKDPADIRKNFQNLKKGRINLTIDKVANGK